MNWHSIDGNFDFADKKIVFQGQPTKYTDAQGRKQKGLAVGLAINSERFSGGEISANIRFSHVGLLNACDLVFYFDPANRWWVSAGLGSGNNAYYIRHYDGKLRVHGAAGSKNDLRAGHDYAIRVRVRGSKVTLTVDDVVVLSSIIPFPLPPSQTGVHCFDDHRVEISNFQVSTQRGRVFVAMQYSSPFNEIFEEVLRGVCQEFKLEAHPANETFGPGEIMADMTREIAESEFVIADITSANPNVYYEVGYAHAINKPTILLANKDVAKLPFDVSGFRVLFYENSIAGKRRFEEGLRKHVVAVLERNTLGRPYPQD